MPGDSRGQALGRRGSRSPGGKLGVGPGTAPGCLWGSHTFIYEAALGLPEREEPPGSDPRPGSERAAGTDRPQLQPPTAEATSKRRGR